MKKRLAFYICHKKKIAIDDILTPELCNINTLRMMTHFLTTSLFMHFIIINKSIEPIEWATNHGVLRKKTSTDPFT